MAHLGSRPPPFQLPKSHMWLGPAEVDSHPKHIDPNLLNNPGGSLGSKESTGKMKSMFPVICLIYSKQNMKRINSPISIYN